MSVSTIPENTESLLNGLKTAFFCLINVLTVREGCANSHKGMGWEEFTDDVIKLLNDGVKNLWYSCCGVQMHGQKQKLLLIPIILYLHAPTPVRFRHITDFSDADIFQKQMRF